MPPCEQCGSTLDVSVVIATYNRTGALRRLLQNLSSQTLGPQRFEVVVVDDGSREPVSAALAGMRWPYALKLLRQDNAGQAAARHRGILEARGDIIVIVDDDMEVGPGFLAGHKEAHDEGADVVLGAIRQADEHAKMSLFDRFHHRQIARFAEDWGKNRVPIRGVSLYTGNVSLRRRLYHQVGGFDPALRRSEDRELGIRLEKAKAAFRFSADAECLNHSDHVHLDAWLGRAFNYGIADYRIARKHEDLEIADPWRFLFLVSPLSRPLLVSVVVFPSVAQRVSRLVMALALPLDRMRLERLALAGTTLAYGVQYYGGVRSEAGSLTTAARTFAGYLRKRSRDRATAH